MQSILKARSVIADGMMWLIGDEKSVRTFYEKENRVKAVVSNVSTTRNFWNHVWKLRILNKIKNFFWRACLEALPTLVNLQGKFFLEVS